MSKKSPYKNYSFEEILKAEASTYIIIAGDDLFAVKGMFLFDWQSANKFYRKVLQGSIDQFNNGTRKERRLAEKVVSSLRIEPLRVH